MIGCQLDLLTGGMSIPQPAARKQDPVTSHLAAIKAQATQLPHIERIRLGLERIGRGTFYDIAKATGLRDSQVWKRLPEMAKAGMVREVKDDGVVQTREGGMGAKCRLWEINPDWKEPK